MTLRRRATVAVAGLAVHLLVLGVLADGSSPLVEGVFRADAESVLDGERPYDEVGFEYPPLALPILVGPAAVSDAAGAYASAFAWEMIVADCAIVLLLAFGAPRARVWSSLGVYTAGVVLLTGLGPLPDSALEDLPLAIARFDLVPAALVLAAVLARERGRSALWSGLLSLGAVVKVFPAALYPILARGERSPRLALYAAAVPVVLAVAVVAAFGDDFGSAISYHSGRDLQVEALGATPLLLAHLAGSAAETQYGAGSWGVVADGSGFARWASLLVALALYAAVVRQAWVRRADLPVAATAALGALVVFAPVLSPQFLFWLLPLSAVAYGARIVNGVLVAAIALTAWVLNYYGGVAELSDRFVVAVTARNALLCAYLVLALAPLFVGESRRLRLASARVV